jgi:hypothetical protein
MQLDGKKVWLQVLCDKFDATSVKDVLNGGTPVMWRGNYATFDIALFWNNALIDTANIATLTIEVFAATRIGDALMQKSVGSGSINTTLTLEQWEARTHSHATIEFDDTETNLSLDGATEKTFWIVVSGITNDVPGRPITYGGGPFKIIEDGPFNASLSDPDPTNQHYTKDQADTRYVQMWGNEKGWRFRNGDIFPQFFFDADSKWRTFIPGLTPDGLPTHAWGDPED